MEISGSPISNIKIPSEQIYKVHYLDASKTENKIIIFSNSNQPFNLNEMFSEDDILNIQLNKIDVVFSSQQIYTDDTIRTIKKKIITEIGTNIISYPELYLFSKTNTDLSLFQIYTSLTQDNKNPLDSVMLGQLLHNLGIHDKEIIDKIPVQDSYTYHDLTKYLSVIDGKQELWQPIGPRFTHQNTDLLFQANPYNIINANNNPFQHTRENPLISFENNVLLTYGDIIKNTIYATSVSDVVEYGKTIQLDDEYIIPLYFPLLEKEGISTGIDVVQNKQKLLAKNDVLYDKSFIKTEENLHTVYDVYNNGSRDDITYSQNGIQAIEFTIHPPSKVKLPLDVLFKNMHSTKKIPFIKYNPGSRFEKMYRAYSEEITRTGQQIPYLSKSAIMNYSKMIGKSQQISLVIQGTIQNKVFDVILSINQNGDIHVNLEFLIKELEVPRSIAVFSLPSINELDDFLKNIINETIHTLNGFLSVLGYKLQTFVNLKHKNIEIQNIHYKLWSPLKHDIDLKDLSPCLTNLFEIHDVERSSIKMNFKRVNNYTQMTAINTMITEIYKKTNNEKEVINALVLNYNYTEQQALLEFAKYLNDFTIINGQYVNKNIDVVENPGFSVNMGKLQTGLILYIDANQINNIRYIELLSIYFDSFLRVSQKIGINGISKSRINQLCSGKYDKVVEPSVDNIIIPSNKAILPLPKESFSIKDDADIKIDEDDEDEEDDEGFLYIDEDDEGNMEDEDDIEGGATKSKVKNLDPRKYLFDKLKLLEPELILTKEVGHYKAYSRACPSNVMRQPVILTNEEKKQIDINNRNAYGYALRYGADKENPNWFICPRYWCLDTNQPLTKTQVDSGVCANNVHEFTDNRYHVDKDGKYVHHYPGFLPDETHPKYGVPCCFSKSWDSTQLESRREKWGLTQNDIDVPRGTNWKEYIDGTNTELHGEIEVKHQEAIDKSIKTVKAASDDISIVKYFSKLSFFEIPGTWVFLPRSVQLFLNINYQDSVTSENPQKLKENQKAYLLYTVERKYHQSFIGCIARIYADVNNYHSQNIPVPTISNMRNIIADSLTLDMFLQYHNGSLVSTFQPKRIHVNDINLNKHYDSVFYKSLDSNVDAQMDFYESTVASFDKFIEYIRDDDSWIDYVYLWDIITSPNPNLFPSGLNLVILNVTDNDITDNVEIICPTNSYQSKIYDKNKNTLILVEQDHYYGIVSIYDNTMNNTVSRSSTFGNNENLPELRKMMRKIQHTTNNYCKPLPSMPTEYKYKQNITSEEIFDILQEHQYIIDKQVSNYRGKIIGFIVRISNENSNTIFIPSLPSSVLPDIPVIYMDNIQWSDYVNTRDTLLQIHQNTKGAILSNPLLKVVEDGLIVGILTETNQVLQINPPVTNDIEDGINSINVKGYADNGYYNADKTIQTKDTPDSIRNTVVRSIRLETQFYASFKTTIRIMLNDPNYLNIKELLLTTLNDNRLLYRVKLQKLVLLIKYLVRNTISFDEVDEKILNSINNVTICTENNPDEPYCIVNNNNYQLIIPNKNLISGMDNEKLYFGRIADELLRYKRIRLFMLEPKKFLNIGTVDYKLNPDEVILLQSVLTDEYWEKLQPFYRNTYIRNLNYDNSEPAISQKYSSEITLQQQQDKTDDKDTDTTHDIPLAEKCVKEELKEVIGNNQSKWKQIFPNDSKEIVYHCSNSCTYNLFQMIYQAHLQQDITINDIKLKLIELYNQYSVNYKSKIHDILRKQNGKSSMIKKVMLNKLSLEDLIMSEEYYLTTFDIWVLAYEYKLPIMLFSQSPLDNLNMKEDWIILGGNPMKDRFFFIRSPATSAKCPEYRMVTPQRPLYDLEGFSDVIETPTNYINNLIDISTYLEQVSLVIDITHTE